MFIVKYRKIFYVFSGILVVLSFLSLSVWGLALGIDFTGGSLLEVSYATSTPVVSTIQQQLTPLNLGDYSVRATGSDGFIFRMKTITDTEKTNVLNALSNGGKAQVTEKQFDSIGPLLGQEALYKSIWAIILVILAIVLFITFAFRKVAEPVSSWKYGIIAIVALVHDVIIPIGVFSILGHFMGVEIDTLFVTALLVILGFSIHDTIVVFDRVRENLKVKRQMNLKETFEETVGKSVSQTFVRSINTSLTVVLSLLALYFIGSPSTQLFSLALLIGIISGTYSSIFLGSPLLVTVESWRRKV